MTPKEIIDRWLSPLFVATSEHIDYRIGAVENSMCGDSCTMFVKFQLVSELGLLRVKDARHSTLGCTLIAVAADIFCEKIIGQTDFEINLFEILEVPIGRNRRQCVLTPIEAFHEACAFHPGRSSPD